MKIVFKNENLSSGGKVVFNDLLSIETDLIVIDKRFTYWRYILLLCCQRVSFVDYIYFIDNRPRFLFNPQVVVFHNALLFQCNGHYNISLGSKLRYYISRTSIRLKKRKVKYRLQNDFMIELFISDFGDRYIEKKINGLPTNISNRESKIVALFPSRKLAHKGFEVAMSCLHSVMDHCDKLKEVELIVLDDGDDFVQEKITVFHVGVRSYGFTQFLMERCDIVFFTSYVESLGLPLYEAAFYRQIIVVQHQNFVDEFLKISENANVLYVDEPEKIAEYFLALGKSNLSPLRPNQSRI